MAVTRSQTHALTRTKKRLYRSRVKSSHCRGQTRCRVRNGCKKTQSGKRKSYCRKNSNKHV
jgi:hypothetical protein